MSFITVAEATEKVDKSSDTIRRFIKSIAKDPTHSDRNLVEPSADEYEELLKTRRPFEYRIETEFFFENFKPSSNVSEEGSGEHKQKESQGEQSAIAALTAQLTAQSKQIADLNERLKEAHYLGMNRRQLAEARRQQLLSGGQQPIYADSLSVFLSQLSGRAIAITIVGAVAAVSLLFGWPQIWLMFTS